MSVAKIENYCKENIQFINDYSGRNMFGGNVGYIVIQESNSVFYRIRKLS